MDLDTPRAQSVEGVGREVKTRGRRCHRPGRPRVHGLVTLTILGLGLRVTRDVRGQRGPAVSIQQVRDRPVHSLDDPRPVRVDGDYAQPAARPPRRRGARDRRERAVRPDEGPPGPGVSRLEEQELDGPRVQVPHEHAGRNHARVVDDDAVARAQQRREVAEAVLGEGPRAAVDDQQAGAVAIRGWRLGDGARGQVVVEIGEVHGPSVYARAGPPRQPMREPGATECSG